MYMWLVVIFLSFSSPPITCPTHHTISPLLSPSSPSVAILYQDDADAKAAPTANATTASASDTSEAVPGGLVRFFKLPK